MLLLYFWMKPAFWIIPWLLQEWAYYMILGKMGLNPNWAVIPFLAEREFAGVLMRKKRAFYRPFIISAVLMVASWYVGHSADAGFIFALIATVVYGTFLLRLYWRLAKSFGKGFFFYLGLILFPLILLPVLGRGKAVYTPLKLRPRKQFGRVFTFMIRGGYFLGVGVELLIFVAIVGFVSVLSNPPEILVHFRASNFVKRTADMDTDRDVVRRDENGDYDEALVPSRDHFADYSGADSVVVCCYVVGSNLEGKNGMASINIRQMIEATEQGEGLTFIMEAGGSKRWFTQGIKDGSCGRYEIKGGRLTKVMDLPDDTCLSEKETFADFLQWAGENYPSERTMLVLWDHGGGVMGGYGLDDLNSRDDDIPTIHADELVDAIASSGIRFDLIGFDACLMQDIEYAAMLEPYTDYYLASEEVVGGYGWYYKKAFGDLCGNPGMSTEEFGADLLASYDALNIALELGDEDKATLSLVDTTLAKPAYDKLTDFLGQMDEAVLKDPAAYVSVAAAAQNAYAFHNDTQIDLIDFLTILAKADYKHLIGSEEDYSEVAEAARAAVVCRNAASAQGINGVAIALPFKDLSSYNDTSTALGALGLDEERKAFNNFFSIQLAQKVKSSRAGEKGDGGLTVYFGETDYEKYTEEDWYVEGFEDYDTAEVFVDIPLTAKENGYIIELPEEAWDIIIDCKTAVWQRTEDGKGLRYLGNDLFGSVDAEDHPMIALDDRWVNVGGQLVCYEAGQVRETDEGTVFTGKIPARLNDRDDVLLTVEWDPVTGGEAPAEGHVTGYEIDVDNFFHSMLSFREPGKLEAGDRIQFRFETYDDNGELIGEGPEGKTISISKQSRLKVEDAELPPGEIVFEGVLTDAYQRTMTTEKITLQMD